MPLQRICAPCDALARDYLPLVQSDEPSLPRDAIVLSVGDVAAEVFLDPKGEFISDPSALSPTRLMDKKL